MINSAKEAKEILALWKNPDKDSISAMLARFNSSEMSDWPWLVVRAEEYLAAVEKFKPVIDAAELLLIVCMDELAYGQGATNRDKHLRSLRKVCNQYRRDVLEESLEGGVRF